MTQSTTSAPATTGRWGSFGLPGQRGATPSDTIDAACRTLGLSGVRSRWEEFASQALREHASYADFLAGLLESECEDRDARRKVRRVKEANFPRQKRIEDFDFSKNPNIPQEVINTLTQPGWVQAGNPLCVIGDSGTGKSHLLITPASDADAQAPGLPHPRRTGGLLCFRGGMNDEGFAHAYYGPSARRRQLQETHPHVGDRRQSAPRVVPQDMPYADPRHVRGDSSHEHDTSATRHRPQHHQEHLFG
ncbi:MULTISPECIES: ATP-binding protein [unclassified Streptomyces]|uniref:ATP-binding protein n=1 Tax=unclassified Streptomyces TaxID=2593676 RepID=UPI0011C7962C|nr:MULTISPECIES: ATP-binding protein [unclassified Streptomyces]TXS08042.1 hypothetical protein EAO68_37580 [Streptomyces sp. wa22]WSR11546.1 ATP-binding protein [Streptomyces sp. NBC_01208]